MPKKHSLALVKNWPHAAQSAQSKKLKGFIHLFSVQIMQQNHSFQSLVTSKNDQISLILAWYNISPNNLFSIPTVHV